MPILINLSPNAQSADIKLAARLLLRPRRWLKGKGVKQLEGQFRRHFQADSAFSCKTGRAALWLALKAIGLKPGDEVLLQAFTCVVVPNAVRFHGAQPVFVDTRSGSFNISVSDLKKKITSKTKAVIVQHIFGYPDDLSAIKKLCRERRLILIEDCAQSLGAEYQGQPVGTWGDMAFFSFGRDKIISSVSGGMLIVNRSGFTPKVKDHYQYFGLASPGFVAKHLLHPLIFAVVNPLYFFGRWKKFSLGKAVLFIAQVLGLVNRPVQPIELQGNQPSKQGQKLANALAILARQQFSHLNWNLRRRRQIARLYSKELSSWSIKLTPDQRPSYLRFPLLVSQPDKLIQLARDQGIILGNWYQNLIAPEGVNLERIGYRPGACPRAEKLTARVVNLPTYPKLSDNEARRVISLVKQYFDLYEN